MQRKKIIVIIKFRLLTIEETLSERITTVSWHADAHWRVTDNATVRISATRVWTGIDTFTIDTRLMTGTVGIADALGTTIWWDANVLG